MYENFLPFWRGTLVINQKFPQWDEFIGTRVN